MKRASKIITQNSGTGSMCELMRLSDYCTGLFAEGAERLCGMSVDIRRPAEFYMLRLELGL